MLERPLKRSLMFDLHFKPDDFGVMPVLFGLPTYSIMISLGIGLGILYIVLANRKLKHHTGDSIRIVTAGLLFGVFGSKIPLLFENPSLETFFYAKSIVGGLIAGMIGIMITKRLLHIKLKLGNVIAPAVAIGMVFGRLGCYFAGCCYGIETHTSWGIDFGDGLLRYPTQLFEVAFHLVAFIILHYFRDRVKTPGILFKIYMIAYFSFRFLIEFIRVNPTVAYGLSIYQILSALALVYLVLILIFRSRKHLTPARSVA